MPRISVVVATWNRAGLLPRALASLLAQTEPGWEALIVDDGSTDATPEVVARWLEDSRFRYLSLPHRGLSAARNSGIDAARAPWVTFLDSDDAYTPDHLESRLRILLAAPDTDLLHGGYTVIGPPESRFVPDVHDPAHLIPLSECVVGGTFVLRSAWIRAQDGFPPVSYGMDHALMQRALAVDARIVECHHPSYLYHREPGVGMCEERRAE